MGSKDARKTADRRRGASRDVEAPANTADARQGDRRGYDPTPTGEPGEIDHSLELANAARSDGEPAEASSTESAMRGSVPGGASEKSTDPR